MNKYEENKNWYRKGIIRCLDDSWYLLTKKIHIKYGESTKEHKKRLLNYRYWRFKEFIKTIKCLILGHRIEVDAYSERCVNCDYLIYTD